MKKRHIPQPICLLSDVDEDGKKLHKNRHKCFKSKRHFMENAWFSLFPDSEDKNREAVAGIMRSHIEGGKREGKPKKGYFIHKKQFCPVCKESGFDYDKFVEREQKKIDEMQSREDHTHSTKPKPESKPKPKKSSASKKSIQEFAKTNGCAGCGRGGGVINEHEGKMYCYPCFDEL